MAEVFGKIVLPVFVVVCFLKEGKTTQEWRIENFPNPTKDVGSCGRRGKVSWICDPDEILSYETANKIEELLYSVAKNTSSSCIIGKKAGFQIGVAVLNKMRLIRGQSVGERAEKFAKHLHDSWSVGHAGCDDGAVLLLSIIDHQVYVSRGKQAMMWLTDHQMGIIIDEMKPYLQRKNYDKSVELAVVRMGEVFSGKVLEYPFHYYDIIIGTIIGKSTQGWRSLRKGLELAVVWMSKVIVGIMIAIVIVGIGLCILGSSSFTEALEYYPEPMGSWSQPEFVRSSMPGGGSFGSGGGFGGGGCSGGGGRGGSW